MGDLLLLTYEPGSDAVPVDESPAVLSPASEPPAFDLTEEADLAALLDQIDDQYPKVNSKSFDFTKIKSSLRAGSRTAKTLVVHLTLCGWPLSKIARKLGKPFAMVSEWQAEGIAEAAPIDDIERWRGLEILKLDLIEEWAKEQFARSCEDATEERTTDGEKGSTTTSVTKGQSGNPAYLRILLETQKRRADLLGLDQPTKVHSVSDVREVKITEIIVRTYDDVLKLKEAGVIKPPPEQ